MVLFVLVVLVVLWIVVAITLFAQTGDDSYEWYDFNNVLLFSINRLTLSLMWPIVLSVCWIIYAYKKRNNREIKSSN